MADNAYDKILRFSKCVSYKDGSCNNDKITSKEPVVKLYRLPESTLSLMRHGIGIKSKCKTKIFSPKRLTPRRLKIDMEKILKSWLDKQALQNCGEVSKGKVMKKARKIIKKLQEKEKYKGVEFPVPVDDKWFAKYQERNHWYDKTHIMDPKLFSKCCNCESGNVVKINSVSCSSSKCCVKKENIEEKAKHVENILNLLDSMDTKSSSDSAVIEDEAMDGQSDDDIQIIGSKCATPNEVLVEHSAQKDTFSVNRQSILSMSHKFNQSSFNVSVCNSMEIDQLRSHNEPDVILNSNVNSSSELEKGQSVSPTRSINSENGIVKMMRQKVEKLIKERNPFPVDTQTASSTSMETNRSYQPMSLVTPNSVKMEPLENHNEQNVVLNSNVNCSSEHRKEYSNSPALSINNENDMVEITRRKIQKLIKEEKYLPQQVFSVCDTVLYWQKIVINNAEETRIEDVIKWKDPLSVLLGCNAAGDCKFEPLLVYSSENPHPMKHIIKSTLPVVWKFHPKAKITASIFEEWFTYSFVPTVQVFCIESNIPFRVLLILDDTPSHRRILEYAHPSVKVMFMSSSVSAILQPINQGMLLAFRANYLKKVLEMILESVEVDECSFQDFQESFNILQAVKAVHAAWNEVSNSTVISAWKLLCESTLSLYSETPSILPHIIENIISLAAQLKLDINKIDVHMWLNYHSQELTNDELLELEKRNLVFNTDMEQELQPTSLSREKLTEAFRCLETAMKIFEAEDPNFKRSSSVVKSIKHSYQCYRRIYLEHKKASLCPDVSFSIEYANTAVGREDCNGTIPTSVDIKPPHIVEACEKTEYNDR